MNKRKTAFIFAATVLALLLAVYLLYVFNYIPHARYSGEDFGISSYISSRDADSDGVDDQSDILASAKDYVSTAPKYKSKYYAGGYPDDGCGVCTDVVAFALRGAGYDLMELVNEDIYSHRESYDVQVVDKNIDFRRVRNLNVFFAHNAEALTTDISRIEEWQGGDIVVFDGHIGIVSDARNRLGVPFVIHHANPYQARYEEDILENRDDIVAHYRFG